jgi:hypothetical protein
MQLRIMQLQQWYAKHALNDPIEGEKCSMAE